MEQKLIDNCRMLSLSEYNTVTANLVSLTFLHINCRRLICNNNEVVALLHSMHKCPSVCFFTETWLSDNSAIQLGSCYV
jgi:hypothetical protein